jgi:NADPH:quinone reductase
MPASRPGTKPKAAARRARRHDSGVTRGAAGTEAAARGTPRTTAGMRGTMKAAAIDRFGPPKALTIHKLPVPTCGPHDVLIALHAAGVGIWDAKLRDGTWAEKPVRSPLVLGTDGAGFVVAKGARVRRFDVGDRVYAYRYANPKGGFYAQLVAVDADHVARVPRPLDLLQAGAAPATGLTALQGIDDVLDVKKGETVLIFGASGALGTLAVQFARRRGARVLAVASGPDGVALVRRLGADDAIDGRRDDAPRRLRELAPGGLDAALALSGGDALERCLDLVRAGGRIAYPNGVEPEPRRRPKIRLTAYDGAVGPREFGRLETAIVEARLRVPVAARFPLDDAAAAHARLGRGHVLGRIVLEISEA